MGQVDGWRGSGWTGLFSTEVWWSLPSGGGSPASLRFGANPSEGVHWNAHLGFFSLTCLLPDQPPNREQTGVFCESKPDPPRWGGAVCFLNVTLWGLFGSLLLPEESAESEGLGSNPGAILAAWRSLDQSRCPSLPQRPSVRWDDGAPYSKGCRDELVFKQT